ncbi:MAG: acetate--CoA ligase family protein, partial [Microgenomates group bacterium]
DALAERYEQAIDTVFDETSVDAILVLLTPQVMTQIEETAAVIARLAKKHPKPILCSFMGGSQIVKGEQILNDAHIPSFRFPERAIQALGKMWWWEKWRQNQKISPSCTVIPSAIQVTHDAIKKILAKAATEDRPTLDNFETNSIMNMLGLETPETALVTSFEDADRFASSVGVPVVLKLSASGLLHKADVGGVIAKIQTKQKLYDSYITLRAIAEKLSREQSIPVHIQIQQQVDAGIELLVGIKKDATFGTTLVIGAGGTLAELVDDTQIGLVPKSIQELEAMLSKTKISTLLSGFRGNGNYATHKLLEAIYKIQSIALFNQIEEFEINPILVTKTTAWAIDGKAVIAFADR